MKTSWLIIKTGHCPACSRLVPHSVGPPDLPPQYSDHSAKSSDSPSSASAFFERGIKFRAVLRETTFLQPCEFLRYSFLDGLATVRKNLLLDQLIESTQGGFIQGK